MNTFQDRLYEALEPGDELTIQRLDDGIEQFYSFSLASKTENFGRLRAQESLDVTKSTSGGFIKALEKAKFCITTTVQMMTDAQASEKDS